MHYCGGRGHDRNSSGVEMNLPIAAYYHYVGIDPGFTGAISLLNQGGRIIKCWDMPVPKANKDSKREIDLHALCDIFKYLSCLPSVCVGCEWPTTRPGDGAERMERFGRGKGYIEMGAFCHRLDFYKISPMLWKGRLGLPGKEVTGWRDTCLRLFKSVFPSGLSLIQGPRSGLLDGRMDSLFIAEFLRRQSPDYLQNLAETAGYQTSAVQAAILGMGPARRRKVWGGA